MKDEIKIFTRGDVSLTTCVLDMLVLIQAILGKKAKEYGKFHILWLSLSDRN